MIVTSPLGDELKTEDIRFKFVVMTCEGVLREKAPWDNLGVHFIAHPMPSSVRTSLTGGMFH
jgi:hypothetical protein